MTSELLPDGELDAVVAALSSEQRMVVVAPNGTVNTGLVTGGQRHVVSTVVSGEGGSTALPVRQGPVRAKDLETARRRFVPPPGFERAVAALESGIAVLVGPPGTGRETYALNLLAHGRENAVLHQVDGAVDLTRWEPRPYGVHGYLVMEPPDPFALRSWDLSRLEVPLADAGAHLIIVLAESPGLVSAVAEHLGAPVLRHVSPDPREVFAAHVKDVCSDEERRARLLRSLESGLLGDVLPSELPPRRAAAAAEALARIGIADGDTGADLLYALGRTEAPELMARAREEPQLLAHLLSLCVYGGLERAVVAERAVKLLEVAEVGWEHVPAVRALFRRAGEPQDGPARQQTLSGTLRALGARCGPGAGTDGPDNASFYWPTTADALWESLCRQHEELSPLLYAWLAGTGADPQHIEKAGRAAAAMAAATGGRTLALLRRLALSPWPPAAEIAGWCLGLVAQDPAAAPEAGELLDQWSAAPEAALRGAVAYACRPDRGGPPLDRTLELLERLIQTLGGDRDDADVAVSIKDALVQHFMVGDTLTKDTILGRIPYWAESDGIPGLVVAQAFLLMAATDRAWCRERILGGAEGTSRVVRLTGHTLSEPSTYESMRDVLLDWCREADAAPEPDPALTALLEGLTAARRPGFLRWLLAVERGPDAVPGKELAVSLLASWRTRNSVREFGPKGNQR
ncbi:hypothetical protein ABZ714_24335 [Streptomyces sp. NPDC006798]|uniref:hypothetical protein n=1 Tax=Streptomyces sp. NPDC006798 TaxID=3155462 RepID=UPI0033EFD46C